MKRKTPTKASAPPKHPGPALAWMSATDSHVALRIPHDELAVAGLHALPSAGRLWVAAEATWLICPLVWEQAKELLEQRYTTVDVHPSVARYVASLKTLERRMRAAEVRRAQLEQRGGAVVIDFQEARRRLGGGAA